MDSKERKAESAGPSIATVRADAITGPQYKLDAKHYQNEFVAAQLRVSKSGWPIKVMASVADAYVPGRAKLVFVPHRNAGAPYLKAHDAFSVLPSTTRFLAKAVTAKYQTYILPEHCILTPSSGRNLGPLTFVGRFLSGVAMSDVMRISAKREEDLYYVLAFLMTPTGQALLRRDRTGTNVDHLAPEDVLAITVPWPDEHFRKTFEVSLKKAESLIDAGRCELLRLENELCQKLGIREPTELETFEGIETFTATSDSLKGRLDAAYYSGVREDAKAIFKDRSRTLESAAELRLLGRYKRYYVQAPFGRPILSGRQMLQLRPVNLQRISDRSFSDPNSFVIRKNWTLFTCDGRSEEALASTAFVTSRWDGWLASNHVMRAIPKPNINPGFLYLALSNYCVQAQLKRSATGSVIDALEPNVIRDVLLPALSDSEEGLLGNRCISAWESVSEGLQLTEDAVAKLDQALFAAYEMAVG